MKLFKLLLLALTVFLLETNSSGLMAQDNFKKGSVEGVAISFENNNPLPGITLVLCKNYTDGACNVKPEHLAITDDKGKFHFSNIPFGTYVVLYNTRETAPINKDSINDIAIIYKLGKPKSSNNIFTKEFFDSFGGGDGIVVKKASSIAFTDGAISTIDGSFTSKRYQISVDYFEGKPLTIKVDNPEISKLVIKFWL